MSTDLQKAPTGSLFNNRLTSYNNQAEYKSKQAVMKSMVSRWNLIYSKMYGIKENNQLPKRKTRTKVKRHEEFDDSEERKRQNLGHVDVLSDLSQLRDHYYSEYLSKLEEKVEKQRRELKEKEEKSKKLLLQREEEKAKKAHQFVQRLPKVQLRNDSDYLRRVPKSRYYHLVAVEELMKSRGLLRKKFELDDFWIKARQDQSFWKRSIPDALSPDRLTEHMLSRYSSLTVNSKTDRSDPTKNITHQVEPLPGILKKSMESSDEEQLSDERSQTPPLVFPKQPEFPKLRSFNANLLPRPSLDYVETTSSIASKEREEASGTKPKHKRRKMRHHLKRDAYEVAVVNRAMAGRLMKRRDAKMNPLKPISEITEMWCGQSESSSLFSSKTTCTKDTGVSRRSSKQHKLQKARVVDEVKTNEGVLSSIDEEKRMHDGNRDSAYAPLSMDMMVTTGNVSIKNVKCQNSLWVNYVQEDDSN